MPDTPPLDRHMLLHELVHEHGLDPLDYYLLPLMPLIEVCWADGQLQRAEAELLLDFTRRWLGLLRQDAGGEDIVSTQQAQRFIDRFMRQRPARSEMERLRELAIQMLELNSDEKRVKQNERTVLEYCIDIAAAAVKSYPYEIRGRVMQEEKALLLELMHTMRIDPDTTLPTLF